MDLNDVQSIQDELIAAMFEYDVAQTNQAKWYKSQAIARLDRDNYEAKAWLVSKEQDTDNGRPVSNDWAEKEVADDEEMQEHKAEYVEARAEYERWLAKVEFLKVKLETLRTIAATQRVEMSHQLNS